MNLRLLLRIVLAGALALSLITPGPAASRNSSSKGESSASSSTSKKKSASSKSHDEDDSKSKSDTKKSDDDDSSGKKSSSKSSSSKKSSGSSSKRSSSSSGKDTSRNESPTSVTRDNLAKLIESGLDRAAKSSRWGIEVAVRETGEVLYERNPNRGFIPASNRKLFTAALALDQLGPDFHYRTYLYRTGPVNTSGTLNGNLVIRPQGDPTFSNRVAPNDPPDWIFRDWVKKVQQANIGFVNGELLVDCSDWDLRGLAPRGWSASVKQDYYAPKTSPLTINENVIEVKVRPGVSGQPCIIDYSPPADGYRVINNTTTGGSKGKGKGSISVRLNKEGRIEVTGSMSSGSRSEGIPCDNPSLFAAAVFRHYLSEAGISIRGGIRLVTRKGAVPQPTSESIVAVYISPPISEVVKIMMKRSNNHFAEQVFVSISAIKTGNGSYQASRAIEDQLLRRAGINPRQLQFGDGSGLSRTNSVTPRQVCQLLGYMSTHPAAKYFIDALPVAGEDGTLRGRMRQSNASHHVLAKTGYINGVVCLSGYAMPKSDQTLLFSFLVNDVKTSTDVIKGTQDRLCDVLSRLNL